MADKKNFKIAEAVKKSGAKAFKEARKQQSSLLKNLINEVKSGDPCKDEYYYETIATANQIVQFSRTLLNLHRSNVSDDRNAMPIQDRA